MTNRIKETYPQKNANAQGLIPILLKFTQNRKTNRISLRKWIKLDDWVDDGTYYIREKSKQQDNGKLLNLFLRSQLSRAEEILLKYERKDKSISFSTFKQKSKFYKKNKVVNGL